MHKIFKENVEQSLLNLKHVNEHITQTIAVSEFFENVNLDDVGSISIYDNYFNHIPTLHLYTVKKDSKLVHELAQKLNMKFDKTTEYNDEGIVYHGDVNKEGVKKLEIFVHGVMPESCHVEYEEVPIPEEEIKRTKKVAKVICND